MIDKLNKSIKMTHSKIICSGTIASYCAEDFFYEKFPNETVCVVGGYIIYHKFTDPEMMKDVFLRLHYSTCDLEKTEKNARKVSVQLDIL